MNGRQLISKKSYTKSWQIKLEPKPAWTAILGLVFVIALFLVVAPRLVIPIFPLGSFAVGIFLYRRYPVLYVGFTWWIWFLGIFVRRLIDYRCGSVTPWPYHLTPVLVTSITLITLIRYLPQIYKSDNFPFLLCFASILYGFLIGLIRQPITARQIIVVLSWLSPVLFSFHLFINWRDYPSYRQNFQKVFFWGVLIMGIYGVFQFLVAPEWDRFFLINESRNGYSSHNGIPEPLGIRVWSTMGGARPFACNLMPGLLLLLISKEKLRFAASGVGYLVFFLSRARTAWYSWLAALLLFVLSLKENHQIRIIIIIASIVILILPLISLEPFSEVISSRFDTFADLENDNSFQSRLGQFDESINYILSEFLGWGLLSAGQFPKLGSFDTSLFSTNDNGYLVILLSLGWFGAIAYIVGIFMILFKLFQGNYLDMFAVTARSIAIASFLRVATSNISAEEFAMPLWGFLGIAIAAQKYYLYQNHISQKERFRLLE